MVVGPGQDYPLLESDKVVGDVSSLPEAQRLYALWHSAARRAAQQSVSLAYGEPTEHQLEELERLNAEADRGHKVMETYIRKELSLPKGMRLLLKHGWKVVAR